MRTQRTSVIILASLFVFISAAVVFAAPSKSVTFRYNPPDGTGFVLTFKGTSVSTNSVNGKKSVDTMVSKDAVWIAKLDSGYCQMNKPLSIDLKLNGKPPDKNTRIGLNFIVANLLLTSDLDDDGRVLTTRGFGEVVDRLEKLADLPKSVEQDLLVSLATLVAKEKEATNNRILACVGRTVKIGQKWNTSNTKEVPKLGQVKVLETHKVTGFVKMGGRDCVKLVTHYTIDPRDIRRFSDLALRELSRHDPDASRVQLRVKVKADSREEAILDPATMLFYRMSGAVKVTLSARDNQGHQAVLTLREQADAYFDYGHKSRPTAPPDAVVACGSIPVAR